VRPPEPPSGTPRGAAILMVGVGGCVRDFQRDTNPPRSARGPAPRPRSWKRLWFSSKEDAKRQRQEVSCCLSLPASVSVSEEGCVNKNSSQQRKKKYLCYYEYIIKSQSFYTHFSISYINKVNSIAIGMCNRNKHMDFNVKLTNSWTPHPSSVASLKLNVLTLKYF